MKLVVSGATCVDEVPGLERAVPELDVVFAPDASDLPGMLPGADILFGWDFRGSALAESWGGTTDLKWIHWCGAGVDGVLFPALVNSNVVITNARGVFDRAMAEYVLTLILVQAKKLIETADFQSQRKWCHRLGGRIVGKRAAIFGIGSIGQEIAKLLRAAGMDVVGVGRTARKTDTVFGDVSGAGEAAAVLTDADWVISVMPHTRHTEGLFDKRMFRAMKSSAYFINVGRGSAVDEIALLEAINRNWIAGAALDVFREEPLEEDSAIWSTPNLIVSPHMSGDYAGFDLDITSQFLGNLALFRAGLPLKNVVDKSLGYVPVD